jgi:hypothetical protein
MLVLRELQRDADRAGDRMTDDSSAHSMLQEQRGEDCGVGRVNRTLPRRLGKHLRPVAG